MLADIIERAPKHIRQTNNLLRRDFGIALWYYPSIEEATCLYMPDHCKEVLTRKSIDSLYFPFVIKGVKLHYCLGDIENNGLFK